MKTSFLSFTAISLLALSGCGYELRKAESDLYVPVRLESPNISLSQVREVYKESSVEIYDLNEYPSAYASQRPSSSAHQYALNKKIPVKDRSVEIYDIGFAPSISTMQQVQKPVTITPLSPPSHAREAYTSPFYVVEEDGLLTDPAVGNNAVVPSVIVPAKEPVADDEFELMTGF
jgi:hypothetical protein